MRSSFPGLASCVPAVLTVNLFTSSLRDSAWYPEVSGGQEERCSPSGQTFLPPPASVVCIPGAVPSRHGARQLTLIFKIHADDEQ